MKAGQNFTPIPDRLTIRLPPQEAVVSRVPIFLPHSASARIPAIAAISGKLTYRWGSNLPIGIHELDRQRRDSPQNQSAGTC